MRLKVSPRNSKLGELPNLSLTPGKSCVTNIPCFTDGCYANNAYRRYPNARDTWDSNLEFYQENPLEFFRDFYKWMKAESPKRFRMFVGGDFPDNLFYLLLEQTARDFPTTSFLVFTKRYRYDFSTRSKNLQVILSTWPGHPMPINRGLPWSWIEGDERIPETYLRCPGNCFDCGHVCWGTKIDVVFPKH